MRLGKSIGPGKISSKFEKTSMRKIEKFQNATKVKSKNGFEKKKLPLKKRAEIR